MPLPLLPISADDVEACRARLTTALLPGGSLASALDVTDAALVRAAGVLVRHLAEAERAGAARGGPAGASSPSEVRFARGGMFSLRDFVRLDVATFRSLGIFASHQGGSVVGSGGKSTEGFSIFALLDRASTAAGRRELRSWCARPSLDSEVIRHRLDAVQFLMAASSQMPDLWKEFRAHLKVGLCSQQLPGAGGF